jgi:glutamyl-tRNA reductase
VPVLTDAPLRLAREACASSGYALLLMDLGVPRNIDPRIQDQTGVTLIDLDTLHQPILDAEEMRRDAVPVASRICEDEISAFMDWLATMPARDAIKPLRDALQGVARREVAFAAGDEQVAERAASRIVAKLLAGPMAALRKAVQRGEPLDAQALMLFEMFAPAVAEPTRAPRGARQSVRPTERVVERVVTERVIAERPTSDRASRAASLRDVVRDATAPLHGTLREQFS